MNELDYNGKSSIIHWLCHDNVEICHVVSIISNEYSHSRYTRTLGILK